MSSLRRSRAEIDVLVPCAQVSETNAARSSPAAVHTLVAHDPKPIATHDSRLPRRSRQRVGELK
jgi:hypothetical protein